MTWNYGECWARYMTFVISGDAKVPVGVYFWNPQVHCSNFRAGFFLQYQDWSRVKTSSPFLSQIDGCPNVSTASSDAPMICVICRQRRHSIITITISEVTLINGNTKNWLRMIILTSQVFPERGKDQLSGSTHEGRRADKMTHAVGKRRNPNESDSNNVQSRWISWLCVLEDRFAVTSS